MCVGKKIKSYLENNGITQTFVANKTGIPVQKLNLSSIWVGLPVCFRITA